MAYPILPKFKEKVMFISSSNVTEDGNESYTVSSSFKGILRLSPNNQKTVDENSGIQLSIVDQGSSNYSDAITFEDNSTGGIFTQASIEERFLITSDSDGYSVNVRFSDRDIEFDNLGVIGITQAKKMYIFTNSTGNATSSNEEIVENDNITSDNVLMLNGANMPSRPNTKEESVSNKNTSNSANTNSQVTDIEAWENSNDIFVLNYKDSAWKYDTITNIIKDVVLETLLDFETIPTGSVHWFPVTIDQYKSLIDKGHKCNNQDSDPLIRDFLLCDGRRYYTADFPELARVLKGESITFHKYGVCPNGESKESILYIDNEKKETSIKEDKISEEVIIKQAFRVPDLRHLFITSTTENNPTGSYTPDCGIVINKTPENNNHRHFTAYGAWSILNFKPYSKWSIYGWRGQSDWIDYKKYPTSNFKYPNGIGGSYQIFRKDFIKSEDKVFGVMALHNHPYRHFGTDGSTGSYIGFGERASRTLHKMHVGAEAIPCTMFLARTPEDKPSLNQKYVGKSSKNVFCTKQVNSFEDIGIKSTMMNGDDHNPLNTELYGNENTGKYYTMLPLIKI